MQFVISLGNKHWKQPTDQSGQAEAAAAHGADAKELRAAGPSSVPGNQMKPRALVHQPPPPPPTTGTQWHQVMSTLNYWSFIIKTQRRLLESRIVGLKAWLGKNNTLSVRGGEKQLGLDNGVKTKRESVWSRSCRQIIPSFLPLIPARVGGGGSVKRSPSPLEMSPKQQSWFEATLKIDVIHNLS